MVTAGMRQLGAEAGIEKVSGVLGGENFAVSIAGASGRECRRAAGGCGGKIQRGLCRSGRDEEQLCVIRFILKKTGRSLKRFTW